MSIRRLLLPFLTAALMAGPLGRTAAHASFKDPAALTPMSVGTATVAAPGNFSGTLTCGSGNNPATMAASWAASTSAKVSGYLVTVYFSDGYTQTVQLGSTATGWSTQIGMYNVTAYSVQYAVTTQTTYGWTAQSARTAWFRC
jgi:hypothetical protein